MDISKKKVGFVIICMALIATAGTGYALTTNESSEKQADRQVTFNEMKAWWDTGWGDDEFFLSFKIESDAPISEHGIKCWNSDGKEIEYIDGPSSLEDKQSNTRDCGFAIHAIQADGSHFGSLVLGETYSWSGYAIVDGKRYESQINTFVFSEEGSRFGLNNQRN